MMSCWMAAGHLQLVLVVHLLSAGPQLLGQLEGVGHVLRRHKVIDHLDAAVEVLDLTEGEREREEGERERGERERRKREK